jgi:hypothetical protein
MKAVMAIKQEMYVMAHIYPLHTAGVRFFHDVVVCV